MRLDSSAVVARNWTVPAHGAEHDQSQPVPYAELAERLATHGPAALDSELGRLIRDARRHGVTPLLVTILVDPTQPDVARQRAFGRILAELERPRETPPHPARTVPPMTLGAEGGSHVDPPRLRRPGRGGGQSGSPASGRLPGASRRSHPG